MKIKTIFMERRKFLQNTCPTVTFAFFGLSFVQACSKSDDEAANYSSNSNGNSSARTVTNSAGINESGNTITLDLTNSNFSNLASPGDFVNLTSVDLLVLKISNSEFRAFDNCCPHNGSKNAWSYSNEKFQCATHGNSFSIDGNDAKECNSGSTTGGLKKYSASLSGDTLTITKS